MTKIPLLNVVVYRAPGPDANRIEQASVEFLVRRSPLAPGGGLGYLVLQHDDFQRLRGGIASGDAVGTAAAVLHFLGAEVRHFIRRPEDYLYDWTCDEARNGEHTLLLQILPRLNVKPKATPMTRIWSVGRPREPGRRRA